MIIVYDLLYELDILLNELGDIFILVVFEVIQVF
jgi:hypothetical protein